MDIAIKELLHERILVHCEKLFLDGHFKHAALEAMIQVELALNEKSGVERRFGANLITDVFGNEKAARFRVPFGDQLQQAAEKYFKGVFSYYRNYAAHDGAKIDRLCSARIMVAASDLLDLIGASSRSFSAIGGVLGLVKVGVFKSSEDLKSLLLILSGYCLPDHVCDGFYEELAKLGFGAEQIASLVEFGLIEYRSEPCATSTCELPSSELSPDEIGVFELTPIGRKVLES